MRSRAAIVVLLPLLVASACAHTPTKEQREQAAAEYKVGLSFVHEAQASAGAGSYTTQDLKYRQALESLLKAESLDPENAEVHYLLGLVYFMGFKRHVDAEKHLRRAMELKEDDYPEADNLLGGVLVDVGRAEDALPFYQRARSNLLYKTPYFAEEGLGWALYKLGRFDEAATHVKNALVAQPDLCGAYIKLSEVEEARGRTDQAIRVLDDFVGRCDSDRLRSVVGSHLLAYAYFRLGMTRLKSGDRGLAAEALRICTSRFSAEPVSEECDKSLKLVE